MSDPATAAGAMTVTSDLVTYIIEAYEKGLEVGAQRGRDAQQRIAEIKAEIDGFATETVRLADGAGVPAESYTTPRPVRVTSTGNTLAAI